jgi:DNA polymerase I-like protein with 3'-5' exonuclease and polymerase domains
MDNSDDLKPAIQVDAQRLEHQFSSAWESAAVEPETAPVIDLWQMIEPYLEKLSDADQLRVVALVISQLAELHHLKANRLLADWQDHHNDEGPMLDLDWLQGLVQRTMHLDLTDLVRPKVRKLTPRQSVAGAVDKKKVLEMLDSIESGEVEQRNALEVAYDERIGEWGEQIHHWMKQQSQTRFQLVELVREIELPLVKVWLALLLGNYVLKSEGEFYSTEGIWVYREDL